MKKSILKKFLFLGGFLFFSVPLLFAHPGHEREATEKFQGTGNLDIKLEGKNLYLDLYIPAINAVRFEHLPRTEKEKKGVEQVKKALQRFQRLFSLSPRARCTLNKTLTEFKLLPTSNPPPSVAGKKGRGRKIKNSKAEFIAYYFLHCKNPGELTAFQVNFFSRFRGLQRILTSVQLQKRKMGRLLSPSNPRLIFRR